jgi:hypothetical protein
MYARYIPSWGAGDENNALRVIFSPGGKAEICFRRTFPLLPWF